MGLTNPYRQNNYQGEYAAETGTGSVLEWIRSNEWDSTGDGTGDPQEGMFFYDTVADRFKVFANAAWKGIAYTTDPAGAGGSDHQVQFNDGGSLNGAATLYWDHGNSRLGLGTSAPTVDFDVVTASDAARGIKQRNYSATADAPAVLALYRARGTAGTPADINTGDTLGLISISGRSASADYVGAQIGVVADGTTAKKTHVTISTLDGTTFAERVRITGAGDVGIGCADPNCKLQVTNSGADTAQTLTTHGTGVTSNFVLQRGRGTRASRSAIQAGDVIGNVYFSGSYDTGIYYIDAAGIRATAMENFSAAQAGTDLTFYTIASGTTAIKQRAKITHDGVLELGLVSTGVSGQIRLAGVTSGSAMLRVAAAAGSGTVFELPATNGTDGWFLQTNGSGVTSWAAAVASAAGSTGWIQFNTANAFNADANLFWDNTNKRLGIGHSAPATQLDVRRDGQVHILGLTASITDPTLVGLCRSRGSLATPTAIQTDDVIGWVYFSGYGASAWVNAVSIRAIAREAFTNSTARSDLAVYTCYSGAATSTEVARFTSNGLNIGNGPHSVEWPLTVSRESVNTEIANVVHSATAAHGAYYYAGHTRGTRLAPTATQSGDFLGQYTFIGFGTSQWVLPVALQAYADEAYTNSAAGSHLRILTTPTGSAASVERVRVTSAGYVQINTTVDPIIEGAVQNRRLVVSGAAGYNSIANESSAGAAYYEFLRCNGTVASKTVVASGDTLGGFYAYGWNTNTSACYRVSSGVGFEVDAALSGIYVPGRIVFSTMSGAGAFVERMRLTSDNKLRMGAYTPTFDFQLTRVGSAYHAVFGVSNTASDQGALLVGRARGTSDASPSVVSSGDALGALYFCGYESGFRGTAWIGAFAAQTWAFGANGGYLTFNTTPSDTATSVERVRITDAGQVRIGDVANTASGNNLTITKDSYSSIALESFGNPAYGIFSYMKSRGSAASKTDVAAADVLAELAAVWAYKNADWRKTTQIQVIADAVGTNIVSSYLRFDTMDAAGTLAEKFRIASASQYEPRVSIGSAQTISIGGASYSVPLLVQTEQTNNLPGIAVEAIGASNGASMYFYRARNTVGTKQIVQSGDNCGSLNWGGYDGSTYRPAAAIGVNVDATPGASDMPGNMIFYTTADGAASLTERMRITSAGIVRIGVAGGATARLDLYGTTSGTVTLKVADAAGSWSMTLPAAAPSVTGYVLSATTAGVCSWIAAGGGTTVDAGTAAGQLLFWDNGNTKWTYAETSEWVWDDTNKRVGINVAAPSSRLDVGGDIEVASDAWTYYGDPTTNGSWRTGRTGDDLVVEKRIAGTWTTKHTFA